MSERYDCIVIGGGPAGSTAALLLARAGWSVALLERKFFPRRKVCGEYMSATNLPLFEQLGLRELFHDLAGPPVKKVGLFARNSTIEADLPRLANGRDWGRSLAREHLDTWLLDQARGAGVAIKQPWTTTELLEENGTYHCRAKAMDGAAETTMLAPIVVAAHGSWEPGSLPTQNARPPARASDLLAFKAHFLGSDLPESLMPLLAFPGGYGGMAHCDHGRVSLSCCVRRDRLERLRGFQPGEAGEAVLSHIQDSCLGVRQALANARRDGAWLAAGPIQPGIRLKIRGGIFPVGNAAGEAHPVIAEGISMALQSAWLLCQRLIEWKRCNGERSSLNHVAQEYATAWRRAFAPRLATSRVLAEWAMRPVAVAGALPLLRCFPAMMTGIARFTGKANRVVVAR